MNPKMPEKTDETRQAPRNKGEGVGTPNLAATIYPTKVEGVVGEEPAKPEKSPYKPRKTGRVAGVVFLVLVLVAVGWLALNRQRLVDWYQGTQYTPSAEMGQIRDALMLTDDGNFLFAATRPELYAAEDFNGICAAETNEAAVLGCYLKGQVYVYDIDVESEPELAGIRETTTAHEMLHAVWGRMSKEERDELADALQQTLNDNQEILADELATYDAVEKQEELYVRAGTEVRNLPEQLEQHYAKYFADRGKVVDFYEHYIAAFKSREQRAAALGVELDQSRADIEAEMQRLEAEAEQLHQDVENFNACASTAGCFATQAEFAAEHAALKARQDTLAQETDDINAQIDDYNMMIDEYNRNVLEDQRLQDKINSKMGVDNT